MSLDPVVCTCGNGDTMPSDCPAHRGDARPGHAAVWTWKCLRCGWDVQRALMIDPQPAMAEGLIKLHLQHCPARAPQLCVKCRTVLTTMQPCWFCQHPGKHLPGCRCCGDDCRFQVEAADAALVAPRAPQDIEKALRDLPRFEAKDVAREAANRHARKASPLVGIWRETQGGVDPVVRWSDVETVIAKSAALVAPRAPDALIERLFDVLTDMQEVEDAADSSAHDDGKRWTKHWRLRLGPLFEAVEKESAVLVAELRQERDELLQETLKLNRECGLAYAARNKAEAEVAGLRQEVETLRDAVVELTAEDTAHLKAEVAGLRQDLQAKDAEIARLMAVVKQETWIPIADYLRKDYQLTEAEGVLAGLRVLIAQKIKLWTRQCDSPGIVTPLGTRAATILEELRELEALLAPGRPARSQEET